MGYLLFDRCAQCQSCCNVDAGYGPLEVTLTNVEKNRLGSVCIATKCPHLSATGCVLGDSKPFACALYPLSYNPHSRVYSLDLECPLVPDYLEAMGNPETVAGKHLREAMETIAQLEQTDPDFLRENHAIDADLFDLKSIPAELLPARTTK